MLRFLLSASTNSGEASEPYRYRRRGTKNLGILSNVRDVSGTRKAPSWPLSYLDADVLYDYDVILVFTATKAVRSYLHGPR